VVIAPGVETLAELELLRRAAAPALAHFVGISERSSAMAQAYATVSRAVRVVLRKPLST